MKKHAMIARHVAGSGQLLDTTLNTEKRYTSQSRGVIASHSNQRSLAFNSSQLDPSLEIDQLESSHENANHIEMLRKIKKARDLVFTTSKRRTRRAAIQDPVHQTDYIQ